MCSCDLNSNSCDAFCCCDVDCTAVSISFIELILFFNSRLSNNGKTVANVQMCSINVTFLIFFHWNSVWIELLNMNTIRRRDLNIIMIHFQSYFVLKLIMRQKLENFILLIIQDLQMNKLLNLRVILRKWVLFLQHSMELKE